MSYECSGCGEYWWSDDCPYTYQDGGSGYIICPECESGLKMVIGPVEEDLLDAMSKKEPLGQRELANKTGHDEEVVSNGLRHLIDMHYIATTPGWDYKRGTKGKEYTS